LTIDVGRYNYCAIRHGDVSVPKKKLPRIAEVASGRGRFTLHIRWDNGNQDLVDVSGQIESFRIYAPLRRAPALFGQVQVGEYGTDLVWPGGIDMAAETLWRLAQEQSGATMTAEAFRSWRERRA